MERMSEQMRELQWSKRWRRWRDSWWMMDGSAVRSRTAVMESRFVWEIENQRWYTGRCSKEITFINWALLRHYRTSYQANNNFEIWIALPTAMCVVPTNGWNAQDEESSAMAQINWNLSNLWMSHTRCYSSLHPYCIVAPVAPHQFLFIFSFSKVFSFCFFSVQGVEGVGGVFFQSQKLLEAPQREVTTCRRAVSEAFSPFGVWHHDTAVLSDRTVVYSWFLLFLPTSTTSSSAICSTAELQLQIMSNRSVYVYVSLVVVFAGGLAMKVTSGANQGSF